MRNAYRHALQRKSRLNLYMNIQCECGKFRADLLNYPKNTLGRIKCYCHDCQAFLNHINRADLLDENAGSELIPMYPADIKITSGKELMSCLRLSSKGMFRFYTSCCNTPIGNTDPVRPWVGVHQRMFTVKDANVLEKTLGPLKIRFLGKEAKGTPPAGTPEKFDFAGLIKVIPFLIKGNIFGKAKPSPFFENGNAVCAIKVLSNDQR